MSDTTPARSGDASEGRLEAAGASLEWTLDGSSLFLGSIEGDAAAFGALMNAANKVAVGRFAAVLVVRVGVTDGRAAAFRALGFIEDDEPLDGYVSLVREVR